MGKQKLLRDTGVHLRQIVQQGSVCLRAHTALVQLIGVLMCIPPLLFPAYVPLWSIPGSLAILVLLLVAGRLLGGRSFVRTPVDIPILLTLLLLPVSILITPDREMTLPHVYKVIGSVALFYGVVGLLDEKPRFGLSTLAISALGVVLAMLILFGTKWSTAQLTWLPFDPYQLLPRLIRPFWNPKGFNSNIAGGTLAMLLPVPAAYLFFGRRPLARIGALLEVGTVSTILLLTQSRGAIVAVATGVAATLVARDRRWLTVFVLVTIAGGLALWSIGQDGNLRRDLDVDARGVVHSAEGRLELWSRGLMMLQDFPFTGVGFGMVAEVMPVLYPTFAIPNDTGLEHVHNLYLQTGAEQGFPGLIATLAFLLGLLYLSWRAAQRAGGSELEPLASGMLGGVVVFAVHGFTDNLTYYAKAHFIAWALFGVAVAVGLSLVRENKPSVVDTASR